MPDARLYYRNKQTGDLGYLIDSFGKPSIRLDRGGPDDINTRPFIEGEWEPEDVRKPLTRHQVALLCFKADQELCKLIGKGHEARREWLSLSDGDRQKWVALGPDDDGIRDDMFGAIMKAMEGHAGE